MSAMSTQPTNEEISNKFKILGIDIGPVTDSTRNVYLRRLKNLENVETKKVVENVEETYSDDRLRAAFKIFNQEIGPITSDSIRKVYIKRLKELQKRHGGLSEVEPMDVESCFGEGDVLRLVFGFFSFFF